MHRFESSVRGESHFFHDGGAAAICGVRLRKPAGRLDISSVYLAQVVMDNVENPCPTCADWLDACVSKRAQPSAIHPTALMLCVKGRQS